MFAELLNPEQVHKMKMEFEKMDADQSGFISGHELSKAVKDCQMSLTEQEVE